MKRFQYGECMALVATDVVARGIDVEGVNCVIHYDPPENAKAYKHRSGRTARGGASGIVISLVQKPQKKSYGRIQREVGIKVDFKPPEFADLPEFEVEFIAPKRRQSYGDRNRNDRNQGHYSQRNQGSFGNSRGGGGRGGGGRSRDSQGNNSSDGGGGNKSYRGEARGQSYQPTNKSKQGYKGGRSEGGGNNRGRSNRGQRGNRN
jgi:superfamily II DNA/RNA helicase